MRWIRKGVPCYWENGPPRHLWNKGVSGYIPTELGLLDGLASLIVSDNTLSGTLPTQLGNAAGLTFLSLCAPQPAWGSA